ncbi:MAG: TIGR03619 family F420-dependent LLM class oxidoreductase [Chloroflexota bacterium]|nr:TIGR03619 family F420-dependent LLM class oxidoreductase [Chloroflexota bacterium]MDE2961489.1 TIGR03619 family F420-dependent LLM class oxidoreductase [Chloroflexota bacterium]
MEYGVILPNVGPLADIESLAHIARSAEHLGYAGVFLSDHIAIPTDLRSAYPYRSDGRFPLTASDRILEPVTTLAYLAAVTTRLHLGFSVLVLPYRHPVLNAKMLGTLDVISNGRLIVGAGVGWMEEEFVALDSNFAARGAVTDEHITLLKAFWTNPEPDVRGAHYSVTGLGMAPPPVSQPHPPIWTGGISPPALRRAANLADGWHGVRQSPTDVARVAARIGELRASRGETMDGFTISLRAGLDVTDEPFVGSSRTPLRGSPEQVAVDLAEYQGAGLEYLVVEPRAATPEQLIEQLGRFAAVDRP